MHRSTTTVVVAATLTLAACGSSGGGTATPTTTAPPAAPATTVSPTTVSPSATTAPAATTTTAPTTTAPTTATPTTQAAMPRDGAGYADALVRAWGRHDRRLVNRYATPAAQQALRAHDSLANGTWTRTQCEGAAGSSYCTYRDAAGATLVVRVLNEYAAQGRLHAATEVRFS